MLPIVDKPAIQYIVEEAVKSGIEEILIITSRGKSTMEDHFDRSPELEQKLLNAGRTEVCQQMIDIANMAEIRYLRQKETKGLGHAVYCAKSFVGDEPFAVLYGDDVIIGEDPACGQPCRPMRNTAWVSSVSKRLLPSFSINIAPLIPPLHRDNYYKVTDMIEKPKPGSGDYVQFAILGPVYPSSSI